MTRRKPRLSTKKKKGHRPSSNVPQHSGEEDRSLIESSVSNDALLPEEQEAEPIVSVQTGVIFTTNEEGRKRKTSEMSQTGPLPKERRCTGTTTTQGTSDNNGNNVFKQPPPSTTGAASADGTVKTDAAVVSRKTVLQDFQQPSTSKGLDFKHRTIRMVLPGEVSPDSSDDELPSADETHGVIDHPFIAISGSLPIRPLAVPISTEHAVADNYQKANDVDDDELAAIFEALRRDDNDGGFDADFDVVDIVENAPPLPPRGNVANNAEIDQERQIHDADVERRRNFPGRLPTYLDGTRREVNPHHCGAMDRTCVHCRALYFRSEIPDTGRYSKCCAQNKVQLPPLDPFPRELHSLFVGRHRLSNEFKRNVMIYNNAFAFASIESTSRRLPGRGPYVFAIQGQIYHKVSDVNVNRDANKFGPLYFLDPQQAHNERMRNGEAFNVNREVMALIGDIIYQVNPHARQYRFLHEVYEAQRRADPNTFPQVHVDLVAQRRNRRQREYDMPQVEEIAAVYPDNDGQLLLPRLRVFLRDNDGGLRNIDHESEFCDPLSFPLLFPSGQSGWHMNMPLAGGNQRRQRVTLTQYYAYRLAIRQEDGQADNFNVVRYAGRLAQKFIVAAYLKVEANRMAFFRNNQNKLRAEEYEGLADYLRRRAETENVPVGRMIILPSSFVTSPRSQMQRYQDAMAVCSKMGYPSFFITMTCNPRWPEITENLPANDNEPSNHPLLICRIFQMKVQQLLEDVWKNQIMGVAIAYLYVIEFQKRGLPHVHMLLTVRNEDRPIEPARIDQLVSAEIPDRDEEPDLYGLVAGHMIHGPCGQLYPNSVCMEDGACTKHFPRYWLNETRMQNGQVMIRRRNQGRTVLVRKSGQVFEVTNQNVVEYSPYLLRKFRTHLNVQVCTGNKTIKYLYKYFFKGDDQTVLRVVENADGDRQAVRIDHDEIQSFLNGRYMTPPEAAWHLSTFNFHANSHHVERLQVHLPNRHNVVFREGQEREAFENRNTSKLLQWFEINRTDPNARNFLYPEFPTHFTWNTRDQRWTPRRRTNKPIVSRMYNVSIRSGELYYVRLLLLHVRGATSFQDLRTVDGRLYDTFVDACRARGLLLDDNEWERCLRECATTAMPAQIRKTFAYILVFAQVTNALALWEQFKDVMCEDYTRRRGYEQRRAENAALRKINFILGINGRRLADYGLPVLDDENDDVDDQDEPQQDARVLADRAREMVQNFNDDQRRIFDVVMTAVDDDREARRFFFVSGAAGTGKTYFYNALIAHLKSRNEQVVPVAWTGLAASLLEDGKTVHSTFRLPLFLAENSTSGIQAQSPEAERLRRAKLIIWDEISMTTSLAFQTVERALRFVCNNDRPFGGKCVIIGGDFKQCLPIVIQGDRTAVVNSCVKSSRLFGLFEKLRLQINMRVLPDELEFVEWLEKLGKGQLTVNPRDFVVMPTKRDIVPMFRECVVSDLDELIAKVFGDLRAGDFPNKAILTPLNENCHKINRTIVERIREEEERVYLSADSIESDERQDDFPIEMLNSLTPSGFAQHRLVLKRGVVVMLLKNLNVRENLCNGTRLLVRGLGDHIIETERLSADGRPTGQVAVIPRCDFLSDNEPTLPFALKRRQFPLRLAYAITINKSQGQSFDALGIYLPQPVFDHGQLYVAFSRGRTRHQIFICVSPTTNQGKLSLTSDTTYTRNVVYREVVDE